MKKVGTSVGYLGRLYPYPTVQLFTTAKGPCSIPAAWRAAWSEACHLVRAARWPDFG
jgi:hypothetical protein